MKCRYCRNDLKKNEKGVGGEPMCDKCRKSLDLVKKLGIGFPKIKNGRWVLE